MKNAGVLLGLTINLHRSPLGGRNFELYSEDPTLSGVLVAAYVNGVQSQKVAACPKHFVGDESEKYRKMSNTIVDEKTLHELYAYAFQLIFRNSKPWIIMASYNKVNATSISENGKLLQDVLRDEWGFEGAVISDFEGVYTRHPPVMAGCDIEMPGPPMCRGDHLIKAVNDGDIPESKIDLLARHVLELASKVGMKEEGRHEHVSGDPESERLIYKAASESIMLLKNQVNILPLKASSSLQIAVFGSPAQTPTIHGGGSASITPIYVVTPLSALQQTYGDSNMTYHPGMPIFKKIPSAPRSVMKTKTIGETGVDCFWYNASIFGEKLVHHEVLETTRTLVIEPRIKDIVVG